MLSFVLRKKVIGPFLLLVGIIHGVRTAGEMVEARKLAEAGVKVPAEAIGHRVASGGRGIEIFELNVRYRPGNAAPVEREFTVSQGRFESTRDGQPVEVRYHASDPLVAELVGSEKTPGATLVFSAILVIAGGLTTYLVYQKRSPGPVKVPDGF